MTTTKRIFALALAALITAAPVASAHGNGNGTDDPNDNRGVRAGLSGFFGKHDAKENDSKRDRTSNQDQNDDRASKADRFTHGSMNLALGTGLHLGMSIEDRIEALERFEARVDASTRLTADQKADLKASIDAQINLLNDYQDRIDNGESTADIKADLKADLKDLRKHVAFDFTFTTAAMSAAADRALAIVDRMETLGDRLEARIDDERDAGTDVTVAAAAYADFTAHIADARVSAQAAADVMADVSSDDDTATVRAAIADARADLEDAYQSLKAAREEVKTILDELDITLTADLEIK